MIDSPVDPGEPESIRPPGVESPSVGEIIPAILHSLATLLSAKFRLFEKEFSSDTAHLKVAAAWMAVGALVATLALGLAGAGAALLLGQWLDSPGGGFLIVAAIYLVAALIAVAIARSRLRRMNGFLRATLEDLKRDMEWLKDLF